MTAISVDIGEIIDDKMEFKTFLTGSVTGGK